ncbi:cytochrome P450 [Periconia macrospinosa]|uniref:Cytochrome P450 n=1 Tax=Periconia macrospinosa TaxID=97972 RepID=A0A2V1DCQ0_9PLEO|nr:cytochrome P450 [Periconia macrospinosa]
MLRSVYLLRFHPLSRFPGPRIAAISNTWYAYAWFSGKYPFIIANAFKKYGVGDVVRIAPNEVVFLTPQAYHDIYTPPKSGGPTFLKSDMHVGGESTTSIFTEGNPEKHRAMRRVWDAAFKNAMVKQYHPSINQHLERFISKVEGLQEGFNLTEWLEWLYLDIGGSLTFNHDYDCVAKGREDKIIETAPGVGWFFTVRFVMRRFPLLYPLHMFLLPLKTLLSSLDISKTTENAVSSRIERQNELKDKDYMSVAFDDAGGARTTQSRGFLTAGASILIFGHVESAAVITAAFYFLMNNSASLERLNREIRTTFSSSDSITDDALRQLPWLEAVINETMRLHTNVPYGLPRICPGATIDGSYIAKGCVVSSAAFATTHSSRYFARPFDFRPERWLSSTHEYYEDVFAEDVRTAFRPFSIGARKCIGQPVAMLLMRMVLAKICFEFDIEMINKGEVNWNRDLVFSTIWRKPEVFARFHPVSRNG